MTCRDSPGIFSSADNKGLESSFRYFFMSSGDTCVSHKLEC